MIAFFKKKNPKIIELEKDLFILQQTFNNAKRDLSTGIKENELEEMLNNKFISEKDYLEIKNAIQSLKTIVELYPSIIEETKKQIKILESEK